MFELTFENVMYTLIMGYLFMDSSESMHYCYSALEA
ncbi:hypothetical protein LCGC14_0195300 [marine sediment metagenome]|uniref:Uncharacterized protein n=1 Tax=marine sediment metagenome TaxID=412755 RepID=A0A0F9V1V0_9ZZZZ